jgi:ubiquinone biosynthesis accessory factor UbiJ
VLTTTLEKLLNRGLPRSPRARQLCAQLSGKSLAVLIRDIARVRVTSNGATLSLSREDTRADATLEGGPLGLLALSGPSAQAVLQRGEVTITGDGETARQFQELAQLLQPDFEEELSHLFGDVAAHQLARVARAGGRFAARAADTTLTNLAEYLGHERADLVPRSEGEQFLRGVDAVREGVDRLQARLDALARRRGVS